MPAGIELLSVIPVVEVLTVAPVASRTHVREVQLVFSLLTVIVPSPPFSQRLSLAGVPPLATVMVVEAVSV